MHCRWTVDGLELEDELIGRCCSEAADEGDVVDVDGEHDLRC